MNIAVVGLGIIGGSFCKAIKKYTDHRVIGINRTKSTAEKALKEGAIDEIGTHESLENADLIILSMYPQAVVDYVARYGEYIKKGAVVTDVSGIKRAICPQMTKLSEKFGFVFAGSHPMAGKETNGFDVSDADLYKNASYIIVPCKADNSVVNMLSDFAKSIGFGTVKITTPEEHDRMIAFTSRLIFTQVSITSSMCSRASPLASISKNSLSLIQPYLITSAIPSVMNWSGRVERVSGSIKTAFG